jgi:hypothetical protein
MNNCFLPKCFPVSLNEKEDYSKLFVGKNIEKFNTPYTCPEGWTQEKTTDEYGNIDAIDSCHARCPNRRQQDRGSSMWFPFGPKEGGYPLNRRSADDFCADMANSPYTEDDHWKFWNAFRTNKVPVWPPTDPKQAADVAEADRLNAIQAKAKRDEAERAAAAENKRIQDAYADFARYAEQQKTINDARQAVYLERGRVSIEVAREKYEQSEREAKEKSEANKLETERIRKENEERNKADEERIKLVKEYQEQEHMKRIKENEDRMRANLNASSTGSSFNPNLLPPPSTPPPTSTSSNQYYSDRQGPSIYTGASPPTSASSNSYYSDPQKSFLYTGASPPTGLSSPVVRDESVVKKNTQWIAGIENMYVIIGIVGGLLFILLIKKK